MKITRFIFIKGFEGVIEGVKPLNTKDEADKAFLDHTGLTFEQLYDGTYESEADKYDPSRIEEIEIKITDSEIRKHEEEDYLAIIKWHTEDLEQVFQQNGVAYTEANVKALLESNTLGGLVDMSISTGWEALDGIVGDAIRAGVLEATEEIEKD